MGLLLGGLLVVVDRLTTSWFTPVLAAALTVTAWKALTGGLHLDGLADCLDGLAGGDPDRRLAIMRDSRIGTYGVTGLILLLMVVVFALGAIEGPARWRGLLVAPVLGRAMPPLLARLFPSVASGRSAEFRAELGKAAPVVAIALAALVTIAVLGLAGVLALTAGIGLTILLGAFMVRRLGGVSGDVHGAAVECTELAVLLTVAAAHPVR